MRFFIFIVLILMMNSVSWAQQQRQRLRPQAPPSAAMEARNRGYLVDQGIAKGLISVEYNSWFEKLSVTNISTGVDQDSKAEYYGFGLNYEQNFYQPKWGWGVGGGVAMGTAVGGDKSGTLQYFEARVPWTTVRLAPRLFYRWNPQTDLGFDVITIYKTAKWPDTTGGRKILSGAELVAGVFVDLRVRFNAKLELIQSFGMLYKDESTFWRLGLGYRL